jgi:hypothetical protein
VLQNDAAVAIERRRGYGKLLTNNLRGNFGQLRAKSGGIQIKYKSKYGCTLCCADFLVQKVKEKCLADMLKTSMNALRS